MKLKNVGIIIGREYSTRVKKKSFFLLTFIAPIFFAALMILPTVIMLNSKQKQVKLAVVDKSGIVMSHLSDDDMATFADYSTLDGSAVRGQLKELGLNALLCVSPIDTANNTVSIESYSEKPLSVDLIQEIEDSVNVAVEDYRISTYGIKDLKDIMGSVKSDVSLTTYTLDESGEAKVSSSDVYMMVSLILGMIIFIFIETFTGSVMSSVIEEKSSRVIEVLISSVKSTELLFGKIIGVALVALTQFAMWILLTGIIVVVAGGIIGVDNMSAVASDPTMQQAAGMDMTGLTAGMAAQADTTSVAPDEMTAVVTTLQSMNWGEIIVCFFIYFILGYLLYASLMAAVGSASENADDSQQLVLPITIPLIIGFFMAIYTFNAPDSGIAFWGSMIPFTSPLVMLARIPYGVPFWELALSVVLLLLTFILCGWIGAKIYRAGILMFGKKTTFKDLWKWLRQS